MEVFRELLVHKVPKLAKHLQKLQNSTNEPSFEPPIINVRLFHPIRWTSIINRFMLLGFHNSVVFDAFQQLPAILHRVENLGLDYDRGQWRTSQGCFEHLENPRRPDTQWDQNCGRFLLQNGKRLGGTFKWHARRSKPTDCDDLFAWSHQGSAEFEAKASDSVLQ